MTFEATLLLSRLRETAKASVTAVSPTASSSAVVAEMPTMAGAGDLPAVNIGGYGDTITEAALAFSGPIGENPSDSGPTVIPATSLYPNFVQTLSAYSIITPAPSNGEFLLNYSPSGSLPKFRLFPKMIAF